MKLIWMICDDDNNTVAAPTWDAAVRAWIRCWGITDDSNAAWDEILQRYLTLREQYGADWQEKLIAWGPKDFGDIYSGQYYANQIPYYEE